MILRILFSLILLGFSLSACSKKPDCIVADSVQEIRNETLNEKGLHLYLRTSGLSEKEHFYELFKGAPSFNECGMATIDALSQVHVDTSLGAPKKLIVENNKIDIEYKYGEPGNQLESVIIVIN